MENEMKFCQSCGMPLTEEILGNGKDTAYWSASMGRGLRPV